MADAARVIRVSLLDRLAAAPFFLLGGKGGAMGLDYLQQLQPLVDEAMAWLPNAAMGCADSCLENDLANAGDQLRVVFERVIFPGVPQLRETIQANGWDADIWLDKIAKMGPVVTGDGVMKIPAAAGALACQNMDVLAGLAKKVIGLTQDSSNDRLDLRTLNVNLISGFGGSGFTLMLVLAYLIYLLYLDPSVANGRESTLRLVLTGASLASGDTGMYKTYQSIQAAALMTLNTLMLEGTDTRDSRFAGCLPGFKPYLVSGDNLPADPFFDVALIEQCDLNGVPHPNQLLQRTVARDQLLRQQFPGWVSNMRAWMADYHLKQLRPLELAQRASHRFSTFALAEVEPSPEINPVRALLWQGSAADMVLGDERATGPVLDFGLATLLGQKAVLKERLTAAGIKAPIQEELAREIAVDPMRVIQEQLDNLQNLYPRRLAEELGTDTTEVGARQLHLVVTSVLEVFRTALAERKTQGDYKRLAAELDALITSLETEQGRTNAPNAASSADLDARLNRLARSIEAENQKGAGKQRWVDVAMYFARNLLGQPQPTEDANINPQSLVIARNAADALRTAVIQIIDQEVELRVKIMLVFLLEEAREARASLADQIQAITTLAATAKAEATRRQATGGISDAFLFTIMPSMAVLRAGVNVTNAELAVILEKLLDPACLLTDAFTASALPELDFLELYNQCPEAQAWFEKRLRHLVPLAQINKAELRGLGVGKGSSGSDLPIHRFAFYAPEFASIVERSAQGTKITPVIVSGGFKSLKVYVWLPGLPARAFQTVSFCEQALKEIKDNEAVGEDHLFLEFSWARHSGLPFLTLGKQEKKHNKIGPALLLHPKASQPSGLALELEGVPVFGTPQKYPFVVYKGKRYEIDTEPSKPTVVGDITFSTTNGKVSFVDKNPSKVQELDGPPPERGKPAQVLEEKAVVGGTITELEVRTQIRDDKTGQEYIFWTDDRVIWQDAHGRWKIAVNIDGEEPFQRSLGQDGGTDDLRVAFDIIAGDEGYMDAVDAWLRKCIATHGAGVYDLLLDANAQMERQIRIWQHEIDETKLPQVPAEKRGERELVEHYVLPVAARIYDCSAGLNATPRWHLDLTKGRALPKRGTGRPALKIAAAGP